MKKIMILILNLLLVILLTVICIVTIFSKTVLNKDYIEKSLEKSNYYNKLHASIQNEFDTYLAQVGIPEGTLNNIYTMQELKTDVNKTLDGIYNNGAMNTNNAHMIEKIKTLLSQYTTNTAKLISEITTVYNKKVTISSKYIKVIGSKMAKLTRIIKTGIIVLAVVSIIILIIMCAMIFNFKVIINHLGILLGTSGILNIIIKLFLGSKFNHIFLLNTAFSEGVIYIINDIFNIILNLGIGLAIVGAILIICGNFKETRQNNKKEMEN